MLSIIEELKKHFQGENTVNNITFLTLNENFKSIEDSNVMKIALFLHQKTAVQAMIELENNSFIKIGDTEIINRAGVLSEPVGSGKTIEMLALISMNKISKKNLAFETYHSYKTSFCDSNTGFIKKEYKKRINSTLIIVGRSVYEQWVNSINEFTYLDFVSIGNKRELESFLFMNFSKLPEIVLVKNDSTTSNLTVPNIINLSNTSTQHFISVISLMNNYCWRRVVIDDFDTIKIPQDLNSINAIFTWFISSTRRLSKYNLNQVNNGDLEKVLPLITDKNYKNIAKNNILFKYFNVRNDINFIKKSYRIPLLELFYVEVYCMEDRIIELISDITENKKIVELLNSSAINEVSEICKSESTNIVDIYIKLLGDAYSKYLKVKKDIEFVENILNNLDKLDLSEKGYRYTLEMLKSGIVPEYKNVKIETMLKTKLEELEEKVSNYYAPIQRVKDRLQEEDCQICCQKYGTDIDKIIICKQCNFLICENCVLQISRNRINPICPNCRGSINYSSDAVIINYNELKEIRNSGDNINCLDKFDYLIDIIMNKKVKTNTVNLDIKNVVFGKERLPESEIRKLLIYTVSKETIDLIKNKFNSLNLKYFTLHGTTTEMFETIKEFENYKDNSALIVQSTTHCAGINLQFATDLVFMHWIHDVDVMSQIIGRIQRINRTTQPRVYYLLNSNEIFSMRFFLKKETNLNINPNEIVDNSTDVVVDESD